MENNIISHYSNDILMPIEKFLKEQERSFNKSKILLSDDKKKIIEKVQKLYNEKLENFSKICEEQYNLNKNDIQK